MRIFTLCTLVDITHTGIVRGYVHNQPPYPDWAGQLVNSNASWSRSRNQQRNWETILQLLKLRAQPVIIDYPRKINFCSTVNYEFGEDCIGYNCMVWTVDFELANPNIVGAGNNPFYYLELDFDQIPIITQLTERVNIDPACICMSGRKKNTYFQEKFSPVCINTVCPFDSQG